ncbi:uncharacterized protein [Aquarana catesbeiana]|uniref:uncharacterized protein n=1 Tax=Aquarana catesbeiana TaxID=8400 RepID=UPI003CCA058B
MGMPQPGSPETSENAVSEGHDRSQRTSMESPKATQPSCLRGGFICLFLKRTEQDRSLEDASSSNQSTEDKHEVRGKKRKVLSGNIFRLPCLRPAERKEIGEQINAQVNKVDEQGNQAIPEDELKPYSKASFLRKIRGYRLMRERDATEKEKVIEMEQCKEGFFVEEHHEKIIDLGGKVTKPKIHEDILGDKGKMSEEKESDEIMKGEKACKVEARKVELSADQGDREIKNLRDPEKTVDEKDNGEMNIGVKRNCMAEYKNPTNNVEELGNDLKEQESHAGKGNRHKDKDILSQESHKEIVEDLGNKITKQEQTEGIPEPGDSANNLEINSKRVHELDDDLQEHNQFIHTKKADDVANDLPENGVIMENAGKLENYLQEQKCPEENTGDIAKSSTTQEESEGRARSAFSEHKKDGEVLPDVIDQESHAEIAEDTQKKQDKVEESVENLPKIKTHEEVVGESESHLIDRDSYKEKRDHLLEKEIHVENMKEPENLSQKQNIQIGKIEKTDHSPEQNSHIQKEEKTMDQFPDQASHIQKEENAGDHLLEQNSHSQKESKTRYHFLEEKAGGQFLEEACHKHKDGKAEDQLLEEDCHKHKDGKAEDHFLKEVCHKQKHVKADDQFLEEYYHKHKDGKAEDQFLEEDCQKHKDGKAGDQFVEEDCQKHKDGKAEDQFPEEECHKHKNGKADDQFLEEDYHKHKNGKAENQFLEEDCQKHKDGKAEDQFVEEDCQKHKDRKAEDQFPEEECHKHKDGKVEDQFLEEEYHKHKDGKAEDHFLEEDCHKQKDGKAEGQFLEKGNHIRKKGKAGDQFLEQDGYLQKGGDCLLEQNSNTESTRVPDTLCLEQEGHGNNLGKTQAQITEQGSLEEGNLPKKNKCVKKHKGLGKVFSEEIKDRSVKQEIVITHTTCTARSEEPHTEFSTFQEESAPKTVDFNYYHQGGNQEDINDGEDDVKEDAEWKSLQVEVKSMVQWLVEEASDRLESFSQESQGTE